MSSNKAKILALTTALLALLVEELNAASPTPETAPTPEPTPSRGRKAAAPAEDPTPEPEPEASTVDLASLREIASSLMAEGRKPEVVAVLKKYKVAALKELDEKHYAAVHAALTALVDAS